MNKLVERGFGEQAKQLSYRFGSIYIPTQEKRIRSIHNGSKTGGSAGQRAK